MAVKKLTVKRYSWIVSIDIGTDRHRPRQQENYNGPGIDPWGAP